METKGLILFLIADIFIFFLLIYGFIKMIKKENQLSKAMDHFKTPVAHSKEDYISDIIYFSQDYDKKVKLFKALEKDKDYFKEEVAKMLAKELIKNEAVTIEFIQGVEKDTIKGSIRYLVKTN